MAQDNLCFPAEKSKLPFVTFYFEEASSRASYIDPHHDNDEGNVKVG